MVVDQELHAGRAEARGFGHRPILHKAGLRPLGIAGGARVQGHEETGPRRERPARQRQPHPGLRIEQDGGTVGGQLPNYVFLHLSEIAVRDLGGSGRLQSLAHSAPMVDGQDGEGPAGAGDLL